MAKNLWRLRRRKLTAACKAFRQGKPEGLHDLRVALRRLAATASALGAQKIDRRSRSLVRSLSQLRQLEIDRRLLARLRELGLLPEDAASSLDARWDLLYATGVKKARQLAEGGKMKKLRRQIRGRARRERDEIVPRLEAARRRSLEDLAPPSESSSDRQIHRYRIAVKRARYLAEDLQAAGVPGLKEVIAREIELQDSLGRWNDVRLFRQHLIETRAEAEKQGAVTLALALEAPIALLEGTIASARREALSLTGRFANVLAFVASA